MNVLIIVFFIALIWLIRKLAWNVEEGSDEQRELNPGLNTKNFDMHERRLKKFSMSKYKNRMFYIEADATCYYYSTTGRKIFLLIHETLNEVL